jgi:DNA invertase Pin-like site-specific DNA recombinase
LALTHEWKLLIRIPLKLRSLVGPESRPEPEACLKFLREEDTLVIWRLDRLGRSLGDLIELTNELQARRIDLESLTEKLDTGSPTGKLVFHVFAALEFERNIICERTPAGLKAARARGRQGWSTEKAPV